MGTRAGTRYESERAFHNRAFGAGTREPVEKFYAIAGSSQRWFRSVLDANCCGRIVLDYGCGTGHNAFALADRGARVTGIDISDVAIAQATERARRDGREDVTFRVMNAEALAFEDDTFDVVCGVAILHHLELARAYGELARVLKPTGRAVFIEPLGHNPVINLYRRLTPWLRTSDEHPLTMRDLRQAATHFGQVDARYFHLASLASVPFLGLPKVGWCVGALDRLDTAIFRRVPVLRRYAWTVVMVLSQPRERVTHG